MNKVSLQRCLVAALAVLALSGAGPARSATCSTDYCTVPLNSNITAYNNDFGNPNDSYGTSSVTTNSSTSYSTTWNFSNAPINWSVITYNGVGMGAGWFNSDVYGATGFPTQMSAHTPINTSVTWSITASQAYDVAWDNTAYNTSVANLNNFETDEVMVWLGWSGVSPSVGGFTVTNITIDGTVWDLYGHTDPMEGTSGHWSRYNFAPHSGAAINTATLNMQDFNDYLVTNGYMNASYWMQNINFGVEVYNTNVGTMTVSNFTASVGGGSAPPTPTGLTATPGNAQVALAWNASSGATAYDVKRSTVSGSGYATVSSPTGTSYTNTGLTNGTTYYFVVDAKNANGTSGNSSQVSATPSSGSAPPIPTGVSAVQGAAQITVSWSASSGATSYHVKRSTVSGSGYATVGSPTGTSYTNTGLTNGKTYYYVVTAVSSGGESGNSSQVSAVPCEYNFESGTQSWTVSQAPLTGVSQSTTQAFGPTHSLAVTINGAAGVGNARIANPSIAAGTVITYHVWVPSSAPLNDIQPYVMDHNWTWTGTYIAGGSVTRNAWNTIQVTVPSNAVLPLNELGCEFNTSATWNGTCYIDSISW
jgi:hypothetical protein